MFKKCINVIFENTVLLNKGNKIENLTNVVSFYRGRGWRGRRGTRNFKFAILIEKTSSVQIDNAFYVYLKKFMHV